MSGAAAIESAVRTGHERDGIALVAYLTAGYPTRERFIDNLCAASAVADVVEIGVPFSDPMADGVTIQDASRVAIEQGASLGWLLNALAEMGDLPAPLILMSYLNPMLRFGFAALAARAGGAQVAGVIIPDLPFDEADVMARPLVDAGLGVIQMATPVTTGDRLAKVCSATSGFLYAVTSTGTTGGAKGGTLDTDGVRAYLGSLRDVCTKPICAGFGIRTRDHVDALRGACDGVIVGSALIEAIGRGEDPAALLASLR